MSAPTYNELLNRHGVDSSLMELPFEKDHRNELAAFLRIPSSKTEYMSKLRAITRIITILDTWKSRQGPRATFETQPKALIEVKAVDSADKVVAFASTLSASKKHTCQQSLLTKRSPTLMWQCLRHLLNLKS